METLVIVLEHIQTRVVWRGKARLANFLGDQQISLKVADDAAPAGIEAGKLFLEADQRYAPSNDWDALLARPREHIKETIEDATKQDACISAKPLYDTVKGTKKRAIVRGTDTQTVAAWVIVDKTVADKLIGLNGVDCRFYRYDWALPDGDSIWITSTLDDAHDHIKGIPGAFVSRRAKPGSSIGVWVPAGKFYEVNDSFPKGMVFQAALMATSYAWKVYGAPFNVGQKGDGGGCRLHQIANLRRR